MPGKMDGKNEVQYTRSLVTFVDVLGFRDIVSKRSAADVGRIIDGLRDLSDEDHQEVIGLKTVAFSDSVVRALDAARPSGLFYELITLLHAQAEAVAKGVFLRGGVVFGDIFVDGGRVFGPGLVEAYDLESKFAVYPRIVVSPGVVKAFESGHLPRAPHHALEWERKYIRGLLTCGDDGVWFVDYLRAFRSEVDPEEVYVGWLQAHAKAVREMAEGGNTSGALNSVALKANWVARYHNQVVRELDTAFLSTLGATHGDLLVSSEDVPTLVAFGGQ